MDINSIDTKKYNIKENDNVEDIGRVDINNKFVPNPQLRNYNPRITTMANRNRGHLVTPPNTNKEETKKVLFCTRMIGNQAFHSVVAIGVLEVIRPRAIRVVVLNQLRVTRDHQLRPISV